MKPRFHWLMLYLAAIVPLAALAGIAWWANRSMLAGAWEEASTEAANLAANRAERLAERLERRIVVATAIDDPPVPGTRSAADDVLAGDDLTALRKLRDDPEAGRSPAGLPRRALAALRMHQLDPEAQSRDELLRLLVVEAPSTITPLALEKLGFAKDLPADFALVIRARDLAGGLHNEARWLAIADGDAPAEPWWIQHDGPVIRFIAPADVLAFVEAEREHLPDWAHFGIRIRSWETTDADETAAAVAPVPFGDGLEVTVAILPRIIEARIQGQQRWTSALLIAALLSGGISLIMVHRSVSRETHLAYLKSQFVSSVSHELRAPLGSIRLMAEALVDGRVRDPSRFHLLIAREGARLSHLIENVLDFSRIEEGRKRYHFQECDLPALLRHCLEIMTPPAEQKQILFDIRIDEITATIDPSAIEQAVINLLDNAIKFAPENSSIHLACAAVGAPDGGWHITISDQGPGIPAAERKRVFERFYRIGDELRRETPGTGIGLSIVKHIVEAHGGRVDLTDTPGGGSTFTLNFPEPPCAS